MVFIARYWSKNDVEGSDYFTDCPVHGAVEYSDCTSAEG